MTTIDARREAFNMGRVVSQTFGAIGRNGATLTVLTLALVGVPQLILGILQLQLNPLAAPGSSFTTSSGQGVIVYAALTVVVALVGAVMGALLQATVIRVVVEDLNGKRARIADALSVGLGAAIPAIAIGFLVGIGIGLGFMALIVPGLMLATRWIIAVPARVVERPGVFGALSRSAQLTKGYRWPIFGLMFVFGIVVWVVSSALLGSVAALTLTSGNPLAAMFNLPRVLLSAVLAVAMNLLGASGVAAIYCELRLIKEGAAPSGLADVFD